uniref:PDEase domain-containing protein n=1 Tax=Hucho hucho TaxID=62062 RepID=A0A4W5LT42_9TELE
MCATLYSCTVFVCVCWGGMSVYLTCVTYLCVQEKAMGNRPSEMMDREKAYIPELQISFMEHIAMPIYKLLSELLPGATELYERVATNRVQWTKVSHKFSVRGLPSNNSLDFLDEEYELLQSQGALGDDSHCDDTHCLNGCLDEGDGGRGQ